MSNVLLEGAAYGRPLLCSDIPGCRETLIPGETGFTFAPRSADSLRQAMEKFCALSHAEKAEMGRKGRIYIREHFDRRKTVSLYLDEISRVL